MRKLRPSEQDTKPFTVRAPTPVVRRLKELAAQRGRGWYAPFVNMFLLHLLKSVDGKVPPGLPDPERRKPHTPP